VAAEAGAFVLTHLLGQSLAELKSKLETYRAAWKAAGHAGTGHVTLMVHTFVGASDHEVRELVREPMKRYLASSVSLIKGVASSFPAFKKVGASSAAEVDTLFAKLSPEDLDALTEHAFERYYTTGGLFGTVEHCESVILKLKELDVDEVACLVDFGVATDTALAGLERLDELRARTSVAVADQTGDDSVAGQIAEHGVTHMQCTPSLAAMLAEDPTARPALGRLRRLLVGGEALSPSLAKSLLAASTGTVINMYGPTETTVWSSTWCLDDEDVSVPIGRPIANTRLYVLDRHRMPVPLGVPGELFIGGEGVTRGYWARPELTAERFVDDPFVGDQARMYRTGDLVKYRSDGVIEFLGRLDHQVKIRGHRIELGEIEAVLRAQPGVADAVVMARDEGQNDQRLVGYVVSARGRTIDSTTLRSALRQTLPDIMVPRAIIELPALPLTPNGKVDRKALPPPQNSASSAATSSPTATESPLEEQIGAIWQEVLRVPRVGAEDNFFDLGGHSLLVVHVLAKLRDAIGTTIPITDMFRFPTVRSMAKHLGGTTAASDALDRAQARAARRLSARRRS
jgi:acyl carrier protein